MATEEVGVVELRVRGNEVCLSHPRWSKAMCRGCFRPSRNVQRLPPRAVRAGMPRAVRSRMVITHEVVSTAMYTTYLEAQRVVEPTFTDTICIVIETRFCPILSARTKPPHFAATYREHQMDVGVWCVEKGRDNALGEWPGAGLPWFKKQIGAHMSASSALLVSTP